jgi:hypothetical protein
MAEAAQTISTVMAANADQAVRYALDHFKWELDYSPTSLERVDKITLKGNQFVSEHWKKDHKFEPCQYEEDTRRFGIAQFSAKPTSKTAGKMTWTGTVAANQMKGEITWTKSDGTELKYTFEGEKQ